MSTHVKGSCVDVLDFKCSAFCNLRVFNEGHQFDTSTAMIISSNRFGITIVASPNQLCMISMKHVRHLVGDFGVEKNTLTDFLRREIELDYTPNFLDLNCDEAYIAVAGISNSKTSITIYNVEDLISKNSISPLAFVELTAIQGSHVIDMSWNPGVQNSLACCLSDGSLHIIELKDGGMYNVVSLPPQSSTLCLSWSPKGKQIIIGSSNGSLTQYKPELKAMKQYLPPTDVTGNVKPIKIKWISNFQFAVVYDFVDNTDNQLNLYILNTPKNAPVEFINFEQYVVMNSEQYRLNQYYTIFQQNWNLLFVASSNCTEIGVMGINNENQWQCWVLETRPELPYRLDKQMYPLGMSLDLSSQMQIKQLSKSNEEIFLEPMPVLCVLSSDGILFMYHIENQLTDYKNICKPPTEISDNIVSQLFTTNSKINNIEETEQNVAEIVEIIDVVDEKAKGDHNESVLASYLETSTTSQVEQPQILDTPTISVVKPNIPEVYTETVTPVQNTLNQTNPDKNTSTDETVSQVMLKEVLEDVQIFQLQLDDILKLSLNTSKLKIGNEKDKEILMKKWTSLDSFFKELNETNRSQWVESKALQKAVLDSIAWVEDSKSRIFFLKNPKFKCLLRNDSDEPFSKTLFDNIERTLYYIETQLTHVDDQLKARYDSYNPNNKELKIPCLETIYKSLVVNTNIVNKLKEKINFLYNTVEEMKYRTFKKLSIASDVVQNTSKLNESRDVGLSKLSEQLLKITLDKDGVSAINSYNVAKKYSVLSANQRALSDSKVNKLQEWLKDFKTRRTKITRSQYANIDLSRPVCSTPLKPVSKPKMHEKKNDYMPFVTKDSFVSTLPQPSTLLSKNYNANEQNVTDNNLQSTSQLDLTQFQKPLIIPTTQQINGVTPITVANFTPGFSLGSKPLLTNPVWNPMDNSTPKPVAPNDFSNKFDYKAFTKDPIVFSSVNPLFANNVTSTAVSTRDPVDFSLKSLTATPINFSSSSNMVSNNSTLDIISGTTEAKEKMPFNFSQVSTTKSETTVQKTNLTGTVNFDFAGSIKNKMDNPNDIPLSFETPKPSESSSIFSGFGAENKSKNKQETVPEKDATLTTFKFSSKPTNPDTASFSTFSFNTSKDSVLKTTESETKSSFTSIPTTTVTVSFNFSHPQKTVPIVSEPVDSSTVSSSFGTVKTALDFSAISTTVESSVTETTSQVSESPTPIISEPITPENEESPKFPVTASSSQIFEIPTTNTSMFGTPINSTSTTSIFGNSTITTSQASIFSTPTNKTSAPSIFSTPTITDSAPSIFNTPTNTTCAPSIFSTPTSTTSIFGATTSTTNVSSIFGSPSNTSMAPSIFGASSTTTSSSIFGNPIKSTPSLFGTPSTTTVSSMFGSVTTTNTTSGFGSPAQTTAFGAPVTTTSSIFGNPAAPATTSSSIFGNPANPATTSSSIFGNPANPATTSSSIFGNPANPATTSSSIFGNPANPATTSSSIFGNPTAPASSGSIFCSASTNTSSVFGAPVTTSTTSSIFGSPSTTAASSGLFGSVAAAANQSSFGQPSLGFSSPGSAFGNMSLFGQSACNPSQPANSFAPAANPFAVNKTPSSTPSLFSNQKSVFGQPAASTPNTGFGVPNSGFGTTASTGFGSPAMVGQSNNLGFGSPPMFGSMGTTYEKSSGFNQTPVFGGAATFGSTAPTFGQNAGNFGFGSAAQQPSTAFASLATQNTSPSFGNIAQNQNTGFVSPTTPGFGQPQQTSPFKPQGATFGGTSFSSWR